MEYTPRVKATEEALQWLKRLSNIHGDLILHQSGGCCDGSAPMCYPASDFKIGRYDVLLGELDGVKVYIGGQQFKLWEHTQLIIDVTKGRGSGFSLESPEGIRFLTRSRVFTEEEVKSLNPIPESD